MENFDYRSILVDSGTIVQCKVPDQRITGKNKKAIDEHIVIVVSGKTLSEVFFLELDNIFFYLLANFFIVFIPI